MEGRGMRFAEISPLPRKRDLLSQDMGFADGGHVQTFPRHSAVRSG